MKVTSIAMSFKAKINNYAKKSKLPAQVVLQNFMFERFLERLSVSEYQDKFVIKGGMLISVLVGLETRSTMDLDATLKNINLSEENITSIIKEICDISIQDSVFFNFISISPIRKDDKYGGYRVRLDAVYDAIITPLSIDISTGDIITPEAMKYEISGFFNEDLRIFVWGYNIETILAEKVETILSRGILNTRPRDFYDIYILCTTKNYDKSLFKNALQATSAHRRTDELIKDVSTIISNISNSDELKTLWSKYQKKFSYAKDISFEHTVKKLEELLN